MTLSLANNKIFFQSVILYEVNNWTTIGEICENLRKLIGNRLIPKSCLFPESSIESLTKFMKDMDMKDADVIQKDQNFIRSAILYEFLIGEKDKDKLYKKVVIRIGSDLIYCPDFSHWFHQFENGNYDFDDESLDSESPTFSELPVDVIEIIVEKLELKEQLSLRKVSRSLRIVVDKNKPAYKTIKIKINPNHIHIIFNDENVMYCGTRFDVDSHRYLNKLDEMRMVENSEYVGIAFDDVAIALKNPKLQMESLEFEYQSKSSYLPEFTSGYQNAIRTYYLMENLLKTLNHKISVKEFKIMVNHENHMVAILPYLKPGVLEEIHRPENNSYTSTGFSIDEIVSLDQWKHAKYVEISGWISTPMEQFLHFNHFVVQLNSISIQDLIIIRDELLTSNKFQYCKLKSKLIPSFAEIDRVFDLREREHIWIFEDPYRLSVGYCPIPHSKEFFKFEIRSISIERTSR